MNEKELIDCLLQYCQDEFKKAISLAERESSITPGKSIESLLPLYLSKLYYRSMSIIAEMGLKK